MINELNLKSKKYRVYKSEIGDLYLFDNYVITNFNEGVDLNYANFYEAGLEIRNHFMDKPFGYIANRNNSYSINLHDVTIFNKAFPNLKAYAIVTYNTLTERVFEIENHFFTSNRQAFKNINDAIAWVEEILS
ncbi:MULTISPECIES: hypothetical protein [Winogradskyella]|uniref:hypothetical protein n=1 Tax=Winogradskyella TaxID=286104 RepID=UPI003999809C